MKRASAAAALTAVAISSSASASTAEVCANVFPRLSCGVIYKTKDQCLNAGCCFDSADSSTPCFTPDVAGYAFSPETKNENEVTGKLALLGSSNIFGKDETELYFEANYETKDRTHLKITSKNKNFWEVPESLLPRPGGSYNGVASTTINIDSSSSKEFLVSINRNRADKAPIFSLKDNLIFQEQYLQFVLETPNNVEATFGFGESTRTKQALEDKEVHSLWNSDISSATFEVSLYGSHPLMLQVTNNGEAHGVFMLSSNAIESSQHISDSKRYFGIQSTGGVIDLYVFAGPTPSDVIRQYLEVVGFPSMIPYWSLGFHNCRWGYPNLDYVKDVVANYTAALIPLETQWIDIDYMDSYLDFTVHPVNFPQADMKSFIDGLHANGQRFVPIVDPGIYVKSNTYDAYVSGVEQNVFIKDLNGVDNYIGQVWPGPTVFPDWFASNATSYWTNQLENFNKIVNYDGIWIDMNEVSNFCNDNGHNQVCGLDDSCPNGCCVACKTVDPANIYDFPPWVPHVYHGSLGGKTLPMSAVHAGGVLEYNAHNMYGFMESIATHSALESITGKRPFVLSRSTFPGSGVYTGHWTGDNAATWEDLSASIVTMNNMALFGLPMVGADICGFISDTTEELCARWIEVGAFSPFSRDHNEIGAAPQELYRWDKVTTASRNSLGLRYKLLPHLYTLMYESHASASTVLNALWIHFPSDMNALKVFQQYMWSDSILFTPVVTKGAISVEGYFPKGLWYPLTLDAEHNCAVSSMKGENAIDASDEGKFVTLNTPLESTNVHVRGGSIIPMQNFAMTTQQVKETPFSLLVALDAEGKSHGKLFLDDGEQLSIDQYSHIEYTFDNKVLKSRVVSDAYSVSESAKLKNIVIRSVASVAEFADCSQSSMVYLKSSKIEFSVKRIDNQTLLLQSDEGIALVQDFMMEFMC